MKAKQRYENIAMTAEQSERRLLEHPRRRNKSMCAVGIAAMLTDGNYIEPQKFDR